MSSPWRDEIAALTWRDVNWERAEWQVRQTYAPQEEGGYDLGPTKNRRVRVLPLGPRLLARLRQQWELHQADRRRPTWKECGFIVCDEQGAPLDQLSRYNHILTRLCRQAGLPHSTPHQLRRTVATLLDEEGYSETVIAAILGHEKANQNTAGQERAGRVTRGYIHAREQAKRNAVLAVERRIFAPAAEAERETR